MRLPMGWKLVFVAGVMETAVMGQGVMPPPAPPPVQRAPQPVVVGGTVTGHVYASDTQRPARFADVELVQEADSSRGGRGGSRGPNYMTTARGRTALDGSFKIENVPPGEYFVVASMTGYISPLTVSRMNQTQIAGVPSAHVASNGTGDVVVSMERGGVVTGRVAYDDGTPVAGVPVRVSLVGATGGSGMNMGSFNIGMVGNFMFGAGNISQTDDRGVFRVMGVPAGKYIVSTMVQTESIGEGRATRQPQMFRNGPAPTLTIYAPATMHKSEGQTVDVHAGDTVDGVDIRVALNGLHTVKGVVEAKADGHMLNAGFVSLADATDNSSVRAAAVDPDGSFRMDYVPAGTYTLNVSGEDRTETSGNGDRRVSTTTKRYERTTLSVTVGDHDTALDPVQLDEPKSTQTQQAGNQ